MALTRLNVWLTSLVLPCHKSIVTTMALAMAMYLAMAWLMAMTMVLNSAVVTMIVTFTIIIAMKIFQCITPLVIIAIAVAWKNEADRAFYAVSLFFTKLHDKAITDLCFPQQYFPRKFEELQSCNLISFFYFLKHVFLMVSLSKLTSSVW